MMRPGGVRQSRAYDVAMRLPLLVWSAGCTMASINGLLGYLSSADPALPATVYAVNIAMRLSAIAFLMLLAASAVLRAAPSGRARGIEPRVSALAGTFIVYAFGVFPRRDLPIGGDIAAASLTLLGSAAAVLVLTQLGRSFSVMAEARQLVTSGVYRAVRHPLYLAEQLAVIGIFLQFPSLQTALLLAAHIAFQLRRMHNEEIVLMAAFPEYAGYQRQSWRLIPGIY